MESRVHVPKKALAAEAVVAEASPFRPARVVVLERRRHRETSRDVVLVVVIVTITIVVLVILVLVLLVALCRRRSIVIVIVIEHPCIRDSNACMGMEKRRNARIIIRD